MSNKINNGLYSPSSLNSGYDPKQRYNLVYSPQKSVGYTFNYYDGLRRKLNYIFEYLVFPKYGRYTFIYDITDLIIVENPPVLLRRDLKSISINENHMHDRIRYIDEEKEQHSKRDIFSIIYDSVIYDLKNVDKTIDSFVDYSKIINSSSKERKTALFSNPYHIYRNNIYDMTVERDTIFDFSVDNSIELLSKIVVNKEEIKLDAFTSLDRDIFQIQESLKSDYKLQRIVEDLYIHKLSELNVATEKNPKIISTHYSEKSVVKDAKPIKIEDEHNVEVVKEYKNGIIEEMRYAEFEKIPKKTDILYGNSFTMSDTATIVKQEDTERNFSLKKKIKDAISEEISMIDIEKVPNPNFKTDEETSKVDVKKVSKHNSNTDEEMFEIGIKKIPKHNFDIQEFKDKEKFLNVAPTKEIPFVKNLDEKIFTFMDKYGEEIIDIDDSKIQANRVNNYGVGVDVQELQSSLNREARYGVGLVNNSETDLDLGRTSARRLEEHRDKPIENMGARNLVEESHTELKKDILKVITKQDEETILRKRASKELEVELEKQLNLHKRFWFVKSLGKIDYKILPNKDFSYPTDINIFVEKPNFIYSFDFNVEYQDITSDKMVIELYDYNYKRVDTLEIGSIQTGTFGNTDITLNIDSYDNKARFDLKIKHDNLYYIIIRQPRDIDGYPVLYTVTERFLGENRHPIPFGSDLGTREIAIHINVMVDFINIIMLMWSKFYYQFTGYTGIQAIYGIVNLVHEWLTLETSLEVDNIEEFHRCFRWLRWEAEKLYNMAKNDPDLTGNAWVEELIYQLVEYMEMHHMNELPEFDPTHLMDEYRNIFNDPSFDIEIVINKVKGVRKRAIDTNKISRNKK